MPDKTRLSVEATSLYNLLEVLWDHGAPVSPRGLRVKELTNLDWTFPPRCRWMSFGPRRLNLAYVRAELRWYLGADPYDHSICDYAKKWGELLQPDGRLLSNYGYYLFDQDQLGFLKMLVTLVKDRDSRQAVCPILMQEHLYPENSDVPCTMYVGFMVRDDRVMMNVRMRSQDAIWGLGNDLPFFSLLHELMWVMLTHQLDPGLTMGGLNLRVDSFHLYERHFKLVQELLNEPAYQPVEMPQVTWAEAKELIHRRLGSNQQGAFTRWLNHG